MHQAAEGLTVSLEKCDIVQSAQTGIRAPRGRTHRAKKGGVQKQLGPAHQVAKPKIGDMSCTPKDLGVWWEEGCKFCGTGYLTMFTPLKRGVKLHREGYHVSKIKTGCTEAVGTFKIGRPGLNGGGYQVHPKGHGSQWREYGRQVRG